MAEHDAVHEQVGFILATGKRIRDYMFRVQAEAIAADPALQALVDMTMQQMSVAMLTMDRGPLGVTEMAQLLGVSVPSASVMVDRLVEKGVLAREQSNEDRRKVVVSIAPSAQGHLARIQACMQDGITHLTNRLGRGTTGQWYEVMRQVSRVLDDEERRADS